MSALALPFDSAFSIGPHANTIVDQDWFDYLPQQLPPTPEMDFSSTAPSISTNAPSPPSTASSVASPMLAANTPEQEYAAKQGRRDSSLIERVHRTNSGHFINGSNFGTMPHEDITMPMYTASPIGMPVASEMPQVYAQQQYMPHYVPQMPEYETQSRQFSQAYPEVQPNYGQVYSMPGDYRQGYPAAPAYGDYTAPPMAQPSAILPGNSVPPVSAPPESSRSSRSSPDVGNSSGKQGRAKPRCWDHGCNGRQFSTFSNLLRHQREKSGQSAKSTCPNCGAEFTRTTARNGHMLHDKCKRRP